MGYAEANGIKIFYEISGEGYPVILVHGFGSNRTEWFVQVPSLSEKFKVIIFDNRGTGKSDRPNIPYTMEIFADDIAGLLDHLEIDKVHIIGVSLGGMIVQNFILKYPERVNKVVLLNTFPGFPNQQGIDMYKKNLIEVYNDKLKDPKKAFFDHAYGFTRKFKKMMMEDPKKKHYGLWSAEDIIKNSTIDIFRPQDILNSANAIAGHEVRDRLHEVKSITLVLCADKDRLSPVSANRQIHELIPNSELKIIKDAGHDSKIEKAPEVNGAILEFLKE
jgi:proline-specific peptidase